MTYVDTPRPDAAKEPLSLSISRQRLTLLVTIIVLRMIMDYSYVTYLWPENETENLFYNFLNSQKLFESWLLMLGCAIFLPVSVRKPSDFLLFVLFIAPCMSMLSLFAYLDGEPIYAYFTAISFIVVATARNIRFSFPHTQFRNAGRWAVPAIFAVVAAVAVVYYIVLGFGAFQLNIMEVYSVRLDVTEQISQSAFLSYVGTWAWTVFMTFLIAWTLLHKRWFILVALLMLDVYFFGVTSAKTVLFFPLLAFLAYSIARPTRPLMWLACGVTAVVAIGILEEITIGTYFWNHVLVRRVLWDAGRTNWLYYDLFSRIGHVYMSENILKPLIPYPFQLDPQHLIGLESYGRADANADTGFLGTSYMHFGVAGMILFSLITGFLFRLADMLTIGRMPVWMGSAIVIGPFYALFNDSDLPTSMLTHGLAPAIFVLFLYGHLPAEKLRRLTQHLRPARRPDTVVQE